MRKFVIGNWKMYKAQQRAGDFIGSFTEINKVKKGGESWIGLAVPFTVIEEMRQRCDALDCGLHIGAQNMHSAVEGAFTGEIALEMLLDKGAEFAILGHSERRELFHETNAFINQKIKRALAGKFRAIVCIGDTQEQRREGKTWQSLQDQLNNSLADIEAEAAQHLILAYEPIWAIGTGHSAAVEQIEEILDRCRDWLQNRFKNARVPLLYGGSVVQSNAAALSKLTQVDGILVGGSSLSAGDFAELCNQFLN